MMPWWIAVYGFVAFFLLGSEHDRLNVRQVLAAAFWPIYTLWFVVWTLLSKRWYLVYRITWAHGHPIRRFEWSGDGAAVAVTLFNRRKATVFAVRPWRRRALVRGSQP